MDTQRITISEALCAFIRSNLLAPGVDLKPHTPFASLGLDSFSLLEIILFIERKYSLSLPDMALTKENLHSADTLATCILQYRK